MNTFIKYYLSALLLCCFLKVQGQTTFSDSSSIQLLLEKTESRKAVLQLLKPFKNPRPVNEFKQLSRQALQVLHEKGYLFARIDSLSCQQEPCQVFIKAGPSIEWLALNNGNVPAALLDAVNYRQRDYQDQQFNAQQLAGLQNKLLDYCERNGYPFAQVWLDSLESQEQGLKAKLYLDYGPKIILDSIRIEPLKNSKKKVNISKSYLQNYLNLKPGSLYNELDIQSIRKRIKELPFLRLSRDPYILFMGDKAQPVLFLENRQASKFDMLFGLLPSSNPATQQQEFRFTGNVQIDLINPLGTGKRLLMHWQQFQQGRSELRFAFSYPYVAKTPMGLDTKFELYRRDSTYVDVIAEIGVQYLFDGNNYIKAFWKRNSTNVQIIDSNYILSFRQLPPITDLQLNSFGLEYFFQRLDYRWNPRKGYRVRLRSAFGIKQIRKNNAILRLVDQNEPTFNFESLYDSISNRSFQYSFELDYAHFIPSSSKSTIMAGLKSAMIYSSAGQLYSNELYRIGGHRNLRGFDEQRIFASWYNILSLEWRYLLGTNSYAYVFGDAAYIQNQVETPIRSYFAYGFGVGVALETKVGIFGISYALGTEHPNPILVRNGKIHFGYVNIF